MELFGTAGIRGPVPEVVDVGLASRVGRAVAHSARAGDDGAPPTDRPTVVLGRDARLTGSGIADAVAAGLESAGATVRHLGRVPTPVVAAGSVGRRGVAVTASHNPPADNGIKLFADGAEYDADAERAVEDRIDQSATVPADWGPGVDDDGATIERYRDAVVEYARAHGAPLDGATVVVDVGNGVAGTTTPRILRDLEARVVALDATPDGTFPARRPKPTSEAIDRTRRVVATSDAPVGFAHDGDGDRVVVIDGDGEIVHEDTVLAILAEHLVAAGDTPAGTDGAPVVVTTPNASGRVDERVRAAGGVVRRTALGTIHEGVSAARADGRTVAFAGEPWKHCHPALGPWLDGTATAALVARLVADRGLDALRAPVTERPYEKASVHCPEARKAPTMASLAERLPAAFPAATVDAASGVRLDLPDGSWLLCRPSGTEPCLRLYVESDRVDELLATARSIVESAVDDAGD